MKKVIEAIKRHSKFLITAHVNLEGDSIGSQLAMKELVIALGKKAQIVDSDPVPEHYKFLPKVAEISNDIKNHPDFDAALVIDCPTLKRTGGVKDIITPCKEIINIDNHISNEKFGTVNWIDPNASSAGEMIYKLFKYTGVAFSKETALYIYIAILTDTGSFNYENTSKVTHEIAGELLGYGLEPAAVSEDVYERKTVADIKFLGMVLSTLKVNDAGDVAHLDVTRKMLEQTGADLSKSEGFVNYARSIDKVKVAVIFKEDNGARINVSFRSKGDVDVNRIAAFFGGGGHVKAAGCIVDGSLENVRKKVLSKVEDELKSQKVKGKSSR